MFEGVYDRNRRAGVVMTKQPDGTERWYEFYSTDGDLMVAIDTGINGEAVLQWFFTYEGHARRSLGLEDCPDGTRHNIFGENGVGEIVISRQFCSQWRTIMEIFVEAFPKITIRLEE